MGEEPSFLIFPLVMSMAEKAVILRPEAMTPDAAPQVATPGMAHKGREPSLHQAYIGSSDLMRVSACAARVAVAGLIRNTEPLPTPIALGDHL